MVNDFILLDARGTIIKIPIDSPLIKFSEVLKVWLSTPMKKDNEISYYLDYNPQIIHELLDYLNGDDINIENKLNKIIDELLIDIKFLENYSNISFIDKSLIIKFTQDSHEKNESDFIDCKLLDIVFDTCFVHSRPIICIKFFQSGQSGFHKNKTFFWNIIDEHLNLITIKDNIIK